MTARALGIWSATVAAITIVVASGISYGTAGAVPALPQQPRDPRPNQDRPATDVEQQLLAVLAATPQNWRAAQALATLQEQRGALTEAEATLRRSVEAAPSESARWQALAALYHRTGHFDRAVETLEAAVERDMSNVSAHHLVATFYFAKLSDATLRREDRLSYIQRGLAAEDRALSLQPDFFDALVYKSLLLRAQADLESNSARRTALIQQADAVRAQTTKSGPSPSAFAESGNTTAYPPPPPPPPVPGAGDIQWQYAETSFVGVNGSTAPKKIHDVRPVYPPMAIRLGVEGRVLIEATVDQRGRVTSARVIESTPMLNQSTIDAVKQWRFDPLTIPSGAAPLLINVEARFFPQK